MKKESRLDTVSRQENPHGLFGVNVKETIAGEYNLQANKQSSC